ncbi:MAG: glutamine cyclotransferase [Candidatus Endobugula sp.]|jgi:glutamine cyclotransferase
MKKHFTQYLTSRSRFSCVLLTFSFSLLCISFTILADTNSAEILRHTYDNIPSIIPKVKQTQKHNKKSFTQGWIKDDDFFYESSGLYGQSFVQRYSKNKVTTANLPRRYFAEGLTLFDNKIYLLTWKEETLLILDKHTLKIIATLAYSGEGWGLTHNHSQLIMSDGSASLSFRHATDFTIARRITISLPLQLNELEYVDGVIWANDWKKDDIYAINSRNGCLLAKMNLSQLRENTVKPDNRNVLNGIAYDALEKGLWITGKYWPTRYLIEYPSNEINQLKASTNC